MIKGTTILISIFGILALSSFTFVLLSEIIEKRVSDGEASCFEYKYLVSTNPYMNDSRTMNIINNKNLCERIKELQMIEKRGKD